MVFTAQLEPIPEQVMPISEQRIAHLKGCARQAELLAERFGEDGKSAYLAGLFHDLSRDWDDETSRRYAMDYGLDVDERELFVGSGLLHGAVSAHLAGKLYRVGDRQILEAIRYHTTCWLDVDRLGAILIVADVTEPSREDKIKEIFRKIFQKEDIFDILIEVLILKEGYLQKEGTEPHPRQRDARRMLLERR